MRSVSLVPLLFATLMAQAEVYDIAAYTPPRGWRVERRQSSITYTDIDEAARTYCVLGVYASTPGSGSPGANFAREWNELVRRGFSAGAAPRPAEGRTSAGLSYLEGGGRATQGRQDSYVHLMVFEAGDRSMSVMTVCTNPDAMRARQSAIENFLGSLRINSTAPAPPPTPPTTHGPVSRMTYQAPAGWSRSENNGTVTLARVVELGFGVKQDFRLVIMPAERTSGTPLQTFRSLWPRIVGAIFASPVHPLPVRVRLPGGAVLLYDGENMRLRQNNAEVDGFLYAVVDGDTVVPMMGFFNGWDDALDRALRQFFNSVQLPGRAGRPEPLFAPQEIAGVWRSSSSTLANWVDAAGNYRGDASVATGETLTIRADGTYESQFAAIGGAMGRVRQHDVGRFTIEDDTLVLLPNEPGKKESRYRITGVGSSGDGRGSFLLLGMTRDDFPALSAGSRRPRAGNLYVSVR